MRRLLTGTAAVLVLAAGYVTAKFLIAYQVSAYVADTRDRLIRHEEFQVNRVDYDRGLLGGRLDFDVIYRPASRSPAHSMLQATRGRPELRLEGSADVQHGPWLSGEGPGLARTNLGLPLPDQLRQWLPQYPGQTPLFTVQGFYLFDGGTRLGLEMNDYSGALRFPEAPSDLSLTVSGVYAELAFDRNLERVSSNSGLEELRLGSDRESGEVSISGLETGSEHRRSMPYVWEGTGFLSLRNAVLDVAGEYMDLNGLRLDNETGVSDGLISNRVSAELESVGAGGTRFDQSRLVVSLERLDADAWAELMSLAEASALPAAAPPDEEVLRSLAERVLAAGPRLSVDELSASLDEPYDTSASLSLEYTGPAAIEELDPASLPDYLRMLMRVTSTEAAVRTMVSAFVAGQYPAESDAERERITSRTTRQVIDMMHSTGFRQAQDGTLSSEARLEDGVLTVNGEPPPFGEDLTELLMDTLSSEMQSRASSPSATEEPEARGHPVSLDSGFSPDPHNLTVTAGGPDIIPGDLGENCLGYTQLDTANVRLEYAAGSFPLHIYAVSEADTALAVMAPDGEYYCNDDHSGLDPAVEFRDPQSGLYRIWVTTYSPREELAELSISELGAQ